MFKKYLPALLALLLCGKLPAQSDSSFFKREKPDTAVMNKDAVFNRPFVRAGKIPVAIGGYLEANSQYSGTDGNSEGLSFQFRRFTFFLSSTITRKIKFLSELEFEDGTKEINLEYAALDIEFHPLLNFRGGIVMNPIGAFNQNHDGPRWDFIDRPLSSTTVIPATWSNPGFGLHGKWYKENWILAYEAYLTNGFDESIIENETGRTWLPAAKNNRERFEENHSGKPLLTSKLALRQRNIGEIGCSYMGGVYNRRIEDGLVIDSTDRRTDLFAFDMNLRLWKGASLLTECTAAFIDVPASYSQQFGNRQAGVFADLTQQLFKRPVFGWENAVLNAAFRFEYVDYNLGHFKETGGRIGDEVLGITPSLAFRPSGQTVLRFNYRYLWTKDLLGNPPSHTAHIQLGIASYF